MDTSIIEHMSRAGVLPSRDIPKDIATLMAAWSFLLPDDLPGILNDPSPEIRMGPGALYQPRGRSLEILKTCAEDFLKKEHKNGKA